MHDELFEKLFVAKTPDDVQMILEEYDIVMNKPAAEKLLSEIEEMRATPSEAEISDEELDAVVGGFSFSDFKGKMTSFIKQHKDSITSIVAGPMSQAIAGWKDTSEGKE